MRSVQYLADCYFLCIIPDIFPYLISDHHAQFSSPDCPQSLNTDILALPQTVIEGIDVSAAITGEHFHFNPLYTRVNKQ